MDSNIGKPANVCIVGLGYVGLPLALAFAKRLPTTGFDVDKVRVEHLSTGNDRNREVGEAEITSSKTEFTSNASCITNADFIVVTVPTPVTDDHKPDLSLLESASTLIGKQLAKRSQGLPAPIIVFESTTYPGCTEEFCGPIIAEQSGLQSGAGFFLGYSPERTNFGDDEHTLETVIKVVSGQTLEVADIVGKTYGLIAKAGTHNAPSIKAAEASKVIENVQRDLNIALFNELAMIFDRMDINSSDVFDAAATKWNFHRYTPGLVGGHCIPVDPYYLTHAAAQVGYKADVVLAGRAVNESMTDFVRGKLLSFLVEKNGENGEHSVLILGQTFKADIADIRNSKAISLAKSIATIAGQAVVYDPYFDDVSGGIYSDSLVEKVGDPFLSDTTYDAVVIATPHAQFLQNPESTVLLASEGGLILDVSGKIERQVVERLKRSYWAP